MSNRERLGGEKKDPLVSAASKLISTILFEKGKFFFLGDKKKTAIKIAIKGEKGDRGEKGNQGESGNVGLSGRDGLTPVKGKDFKDGRNGTDGTNGINGRDGIDGVNGIDGSNGTDGTDGVNGIDGINGTDGRDGEDGNHGLMGSMPKHRWDDTSLSFQLPDGTWGPAVELRARDGNNGQDGADGLKGDTGPKGFPGPTGPKGSPGIAESEVVYLNTQLKEMKSRIETLEAKL